jgi:hypothetical protein
LAIRQGVTSLKSSGLNCPARPARERHTIDKSENPRAPAFSIEVSGIANRCCNTIYNM